jgi:hypothetical protein
MVVDKFTCLCFPRAVRRLLKRKAELVEYRVVDTKYGKLKVEIFEDDGYKVQVKKLKHKYGDDVVKAKLMQEGV